MALLGLTLLLLPAHHDNLDSSRRPQSHLFKTARLFVRADNISHVELRIFQKRLISEDRLRKHQATRRPGSGAAI